MEEKIRKLSYVYFIDISNYNVKLNFTNFLIFSMYIILDYLIFMKDINNMLIKNMPRLMIRVYKEIASLHPFFSTNLHPILLCNMSSNYRYWPIPDRWKYHWRIGNYLNYKRVSHRYHRLSIIYNYLPNIFALDDNFKINLILFIITNSKRIID